MLSEYICGSYQLWNYKGDCTPNNWPYNTVYSLYNPIPGNHPLTHSSAYYSLTYCLLRAVHPSSQSPVNLLLSYLLLYILTAIKTQIQSSASTINDRITFRLYNWPKCRDDFSHFFLRLQKDVSLSGEECFCRDWHGCIMAQSIVGLENVQPYKFSECSRSDYNSALRTGRGICLLNKPNEVSSTRTICTTLKTIHKFYSEVSLLVFWRTITMSLPERHGIVVRACDFYSGVPALIHTSHHHWFCNETSGSEPTSSCRSTELQNKNG